MMMAGDRVVNGSFVRLFVCSLVFWCFGGLVVWWFGVLVV